jgi:peroxiredoxin
LNRFFGCRSKIEPSVRKRLVTLFLVVSPFFLSSVVLAAPVAPAVDFVLPDLQGAPVRLSTFKGQPILLKLGTTWCPACVRQEQVLDEATAELRGAGVVVVEVFLQESAADVSRDRQASGSKETAVVLIDDGQVQRSYNVYAIPRVLLIDRNFQVQRDGNLLSAAELKAALPALTATE